MANRAAPLRSILMILVVGAITGLAIPVSAEEGPAASASAEAGPESTCLLRGGSTPLIPTRRGGATRRS
jgi:hypothetical protein